LLSTSSFEIDRLAENSLVLYDANVAGLDNIEPEFPPSELNDPPREVTLAVLKLSDIESLRTSDSF